MSSPLYLLHPDDSLWSAHEEMQRRGVQRLVVSWAGGAKIGIITQTNLLRVFDSSEHQAILKAIQQTVSDFTCHHGTQDREHVESDLKQLLTDMQVNLQHLADMRDLSRERQQFYLQLAIADLQKIGSLFDISV